MLSRLSREKHCIMKNALPIDHLTTIVSWKMLSPLTIWPPFSFIKVIKMVSAGIILFPGMLCVGAFPNSRFFQIDYWSFFGIYFDHFFGVKNSLISSSNLNKKCYFSMGITIFFHSKFGLKSSAKFVSNSFQIPSKLCWFRFLLVKFCFWCFFEMVRRGPSLVGFWFPPWSPRDHFGNQNGSAMVPRGTILA